MDSDQIWTHTDAARRDLAARLSTLTPEQWQTPSLCRHWSVRDVTVHLSQAHASFRDVLVPLIRARFDFGRLVFSMARDAATTGPEAARLVGAMTGTRRTPPFVSETEPLIDILVHTQDICRPLGMRQAMPPEAATVAADRILVLNRRRSMRLRPPLGPVRLRATDVDWTGGEGDAEVSGEIGDLVMLLAGREDTALPRLSGAIEAVRR